ncbi:hypothetical protein KY285_019140 [Solanum tuberosum]|nr:hypothetical protein KY285_019140 [Solanum tuberosum]
MVGEALLNLIVREIQINIVILKQELEHNQVNKVLFVVTPLLCQELLKQEMGGPSHFTSRTTFATTQSSQPRSIYGDTTSVPRPPQKRVQVGTGRGLGRKKSNARGTPFVTERDNSSSQLPPLSGHKRPYSSVSFVVATGGNRRPTTDFGTYSDPTTGAQVLDPDTSSEKILHGPTKLKSASPTNIDIDFKPHGLKWKGKDAISTSQLQQMKANKKNKGTCGTSKK